MCCIYLNEESLLEKCKRYILSHQNETLIMKIFDLVDYIPENYLNHYIWITSK